jgi:hypothetical protein
MRLANLESAPTSTGGGLERRVGRTWREIWVMTVSCLMASTATLSAQTPTTYTTRAQWQAAAGAVNTITFEGLAPAGGFTPFDNSAGLGVQGVRFTGLTASPLKYYLRVVDSAYSAGFNWGSGQVLHGPPETTGPNGEGGPSSSMVAALPAGITAIGVDLMSFRSYGSAFAIGITTAAGVQYSFNTTSPAYPQRGFFGVVASAPIIAIRFIGRTGFPTIDNFSFGGASALGSPTLIGGVSGSTVSLSWTPAPVSAPATGYRVEAATSSFGPAIAIVDVPGTAFIAPGVPVGTYFVRVRAVNAVYPSGGPSSNEVVLNVGGVCSAAPSPPTGPAASAQNGVVTFTWLPPTSGCAPTGYLVRAGTAPGIGNLGSFDVGLVTSISAPVPPATYYVAAIARNGSALSGASSEVSVTVANTCTAPAAPVAFTATSALDVVTLTWQAPAGAARYLIEVGSASGATDIATVPWVGTGLQTAGVARGRYFLRVRAESTCGLVGASSAERVLNVSY